MYLSISKRTNTLALVLPLLLTVTACGGGGNASYVDPAYQTQETNNGITAEQLSDRDSDGIEDTLDNWPDDPSRPITSQLWGVNGEKWNPAGRLPFIALAGYREGKKVLPDVTRVVANVLHFGATNTDGSPNDTASFQAALAHARSQVSVDNPGVVLVPAGVYDVDEQLHLSTSGLVLQGEGRDATRIRFTTGLINDNTAITPEGAKRRKLIVIGGAFDNSGKLCTGIDWEQWNKSYSAPLDLDALPTRGDFSMRLAAPLSDTLKANIVSQGYRIRLAQMMGYGEDSITPVLAESVYGGPHFSPSGASGGILMSQQFVVQISDDNQTLILDRPLRFSPSAENMYGGVRISVRNTDDPVCSTEEIGIEHLTVELPKTEWLDHFGTEGQGGIDMLSDNSWVRNVRLINADNGIEVNKKTFNNTISNVVISGNRVPRRSGAPGQRYDAYGHHGITIKGREHMVKDFVFEVSYVHDLTMNNCHGCVVMRGQGPFINMDHHRQGVYDSAWTELDLGNSARMWDSTGNPSEGFNAAAFNTYCNIQSVTPELSYWPKDGVNKAYPQWGYHKVNIVGTEIKEKPPAGTAEHPYPYHPENAHLESMSPELVWPVNIYEAQLKVYRKGELFKSGA